MREYLRFCSFKYKLLVLGLGSMLAIAAGMFGGFLSMLSDGEYNADSIILLFYGITIMFAGIFILELLADMDIFECFIGKKASSFDFIGSSAKWKPVIKAVVSGNIKRRFLTALLAGISFGIAKNGTAFLADGQFILVTLAIFTLGSVELILERKITTGFLRPFILAIFLALADLLTGFTFLIDRPLLTIIIIIALAVSGTGSSVFEIRSTIKKGCNYYID